MEIMFYADSRGRQPVYDWILEMKKREPDTYRATIHLLEFLRQEGKRVQAGLSNRKDIKKLKKTDGIWQMRIDENRVLFFYYEGDSIVLTNQFKKKQNKTPDREIERAERRKDEWIQRNQ